MAERSQHSNILLAFISLTAVIVIVSLIGFFTLGKGGNHSGTSRS